MQRLDDEGPVYYREIQKNGYLKRIPCDAGGKLKPLNNKLMHHCLDGEGKHREETCMPNWHVQSTNPHWASVVDYDPHPLSVRGGLSPNSGKPPLKPMWTLFCVHNGRTPYLEQYPEPEGGAALCHRPVWRACLSRARHVTASVKPYVAREHDFLIDTEVGAVRMLAPDWATMQDWVSSLRKALLELKIVPPHENVYCGPVVPPPARAAARDPTSPLPPTPAQPPDRVPGIELNVPSTRQTNSTINNQETEVQDTTQNAQINLESTANNLDNNSNENNSSADVLDEEQSNINRSINFINNRDVTNIDETVTSNQRNSITNPEEFNNIPDNIENVDISEWESSTDLTPLPSTSQLEKKSENFAKTQNSVAKICGQNICLDDSIFKRTAGGSDEEFLQDIESFNATIDNLELSSAGAEEGGFTQRLVVNSDGEKSSISQSNSDNCEPKATNITVINVSNKAPPHTAIPVLGTEHNVFDFEFKQQLSVKPEPEKNYINIVHTESNSENGYGTIFSTKQSDYGHISLTTTVNLTGSPTPSIRRTDAPVNQALDDGIYERLCMASTSKEMGMIKKIKQEASRKSSLPNLEVKDGNSTYEYIFPGNTGSASVVPSDISVGNSSSVQIGSSLPETSVNARSEPISPRTHPPINIQPMPSPRSLATNPSQTTSNVDSNAAAIRCNIERSNSHNAYDNLRRFHSPKRNKDKQDTPVQHKTIWKRGLTELTLLSKLRAFTTKRSQLADTENRTESTKVVHRPREISRIDNNRRRSSSLSEEPSRPGPGTLLTPRVREAQRLVAEQARGSAVQGSLPRDATVAQYNGHLWIASWGGSGAAAVRCSGRSGDRIAALMGIRTRDASHAASIAMQHPHSPLKILFHRVPLAKIFVLNKNTDNEALGIKLDNDCNITNIVANSPAGRALVPAAGWAVTEVNNRPINLLKGGEEDMARLGRCGKEISLLIQPSPLVKKIRSALKTNKTLLSYR